MKLQRILITANTATSNAAVVGLLLSMSAVTLQAQSPAAVYKVTDEKGRVTYSNAPSKGAVAVELAPLTVMPAHRMPPRPVSSTIALAPASPAATATANDAAPTPAVVPQAEPPAPLAAPLARVAIPSPTVEAVAVKPRVISANASPAMLVKQRREEVRRRILEGEIEAEQQLQQDARNTLAAEQARSAAMRALRGSLPNEARPSETTLEARALIERHFARVRDLQDQVAMHEQNLQDMQSQLAQVAPAMLVKSAAVTTTVPSPTVASVAKSTTSIPVAIVSTKPTKAPAKQAPVPVAKVVSSTPSATPTTPSPTIASSSVASAEADETPMTATNLPVVKMRPATVAVAAPAAGKRSMAENRNE